MPTSISRTRQPHTAEPSVVSAVAPADPILPVVSSIETLGTLSNQEVYDEADQAQWIQLAEQESLIARARQSNAPEKDENFDDLHCIECGNEIPAERLALHKIRCVECQRALEVVRRRFAR